MVELSPEEKQKIYAEEKARFEAQEKLKQEATKKKSKGATTGCAIIIALGIAAVIYFSLFDKGSSSKSQVPKNPPEIADAATRTKINSAVQEAINNGVIKKMDVRFGKAWIQEDVWSRIDSQTKENITKTLALYFSIQKNEEYRSAEIIGWMSGKKMGSYISWSGFKVH